MNPEFENVPEGTTWIAADFNQLCGLVVWWGFETKPKFKYDATAMATGWAGATTAKLATQTREPWMDEKWLKATLRKVGK